MFKFKKEKIDTNMDKVNSKVNANVALNKMKMGLLKDEKKIEMLKKELDRAIIKGDYYKARCIKERLVLSDKNRRVRLKKVGLFDRIMSNNEMIEDSIEFSSNLSEFSKNVVSSKGIEDTRALYDINEVVSTANRQAEELEMFSSSLDCCFGEDEFYYSNDELDSFIDSNYVNENEYDKEINKKIKQIEDKK